MARPTKKGIDYFSFDVDFFEDEKIEPISGEFGLKGEIITIRLLCAVYRNGYFAMWNEQLKMTLANRCKVSSELIEQVIHRLVKWGFFDENLFNSAKIITSKGIQKRFKEATRKRKYNYEDLDFWLIFDEKEVSGGNNSLTKEFRAEITTQSKVKYSNIESVYNNYIPSPGILNSESNNSIDWNKLLDQFNKITGKNYNTIMPFVRNNILQILSLGYTKDDLVKAFTTASKDKYLQQNPKLLSLIHITDLKNFEKYANN